jgi:hypothetical protein
LINSLESYLSHFHESKETVRRHNKMRSDYGLYVIAVICFLIAGVFLTGTVPEYTLSDTMGAAAIAIFLVLGILFAVGGYALRPKVAVPIPRVPPPLPAEPSPPPSAPLVEEKIEEVPVAPPPPTEEHVPSISPTPPPAEEVPTPPAAAPTLEEPAKVEEEKPAQKPVRRRRRKKTA